MPRYIAFLRAINVGGHTVTMDRLRRVFEALRFSKVETFIASGNVVFESTSKTAKTLERKIEKHLYGMLGYNVTTFIRSTSELADVARHTPFVESELNASGHSLYIAFVPDSPSDESKQRLLSLSSEVDDFHIHGREVYWLCRGRMTDSTFSGARLEKILGMPATLRNATTVKKMAAKYAEGESAFKNARSPAPGP